MKSSHACCASVKEDAMKTLTTSLRDPSRGIQYTIQNIDSLLRGQHRPDETTRGWISLVIQRYYTKLADEGDMEYTVNSFLRDIAIFLKYYFVLQAGACSLALHVAYGLSISLYLRIDSHMAGKIQTRKMPHCSRWRTTLMPKLLTHSTFYHLF